MPDGPFVSVVIPVWRDELSLTRCLRTLAPSAEAEVIVACVLGEESRYQPLRNEHAAVRWVSAPRGRATQMNAGADVARGRWLLFLHADCELPAEWQRVVLDADERNETIAGAFRFTIDSRAWQARIIETLVRLRCAWFGMPYGDQALFVRRSAFEALGGYEDLPLMEDVALVRRLKTMGRIALSRSAVRTSARRWERDGWFRRSTQNLGLALRFLVGASPSSLARKYFGRASRAVVMMARAPWSGGKTRLDLEGSDSAHGELRTALFLDTLDVVTSVSGAEPIVACEPAEECERLRAFIGGSADVIAQRGADLGERLARAFEDTFRLGIESVVVIGSDLPDLPAERIRDAFEALDRSPDRVVLGPAPDGGYFLIAMKRPHPALFRGIDWSTDRVLAQTLDAAKGEGLQVSLLDPWRDVDTRLDLEDLAATSASGARRTRALAKDYLSGS